MACAAMVGGAGRRPEGRPRSFMPASRHEGPSAFLRRLRELSVAQLACCYDRLKSAVST
jgi:hypothetical protein